MPVLYFIYLVLLIDFDFFAICYKCVDHFLSLSVSSSIKKDGRGSFCKVFDGDDKKIQYNMIFNKTKSFESSQQNPIILPISWQCHKLYQEYVCKETSNRLLNDGEIFLETEGFMCAIQQEVICSTNVLHGINIKSNNWKRFRLIILGSSYNTDRQWRIITLILYFCLLKIPAKHLFLWYVFAYIGDIVEFVAP